MFKGFFKSHQPHLSEERSSALGNRQDSFSIARTRGDIPSFDAYHPVLKRLIAYVSERVIGREKAVETILAAILAGGHVLLEDVPGVGKTSLVRTLAKALGLHFQRIQFTPDLLPGDVLGVNMYDQKKGEFVFRPGPIFANVVLADEINRASPKTQSALLEAMEEGRVTVDGQTYGLPDPFLVMATQNPVDYEGTYPLPEAQLDRFMMKIRLGYPDFQAEDAMLLRHAEQRQHRHQKAHDTEAASILGDGEGLHPDQLRALQQAVTKIEIEESVRHYLLELIQATRREQRLILGASPRASLSLYRASQALAFIRGRTYVVPDDIRDLLPNVLAHRLIVSDASMYAGETAEHILGTLLDAIPVPLYTKHSSEI